MKDRKQAIGGSNRKTTMWRPRVIYGICATVTIVLSFVYYLWDFIFHYRIVLYFPGELLIALGWTVAAVVTYRIGKAQKLKTWWIWLFSLPACGPAIVSIVTFAFWKFRGFAP